MTGYGMQGHLGMALQESFGTAITASFHYFPIISESLNEVIEPLTKEQLKGRFEDGGVVEGMHTIEGEIVHEAHPILIGKIFHAWCGQSSPTLSTSHYTHVFKPRDQDYQADCAVPPHTFEVYRDAGSAHQYYDCCVDGFSVEIANGALVRSTMTVVGGQFTKVAKTSPSYLTGSEYTWDQTSISIGGTAVDNLSELTITGANALSARHYLDGGKVPGKIKRDGFRMIEVAGTMVFENDTDFDRFRNQTEARLVVTLTGQECNSGVNCSVEFDIPSFRYNTFPVNIGGPGMIEVGFDGRAIYNEGSGTMIEITVVNTLAQYGI